MAGTGRGVGGRLMQVGVAGSLGCLSDLAAVGVMSMWPPQAWAVAGPESPHCRARDSHAAVGAGAQPAAGGQSWVTGDRCVPAKSLSLCCPPGSG